MTQLASTATNNNISALNARVAEISAANDIRNFDDLTEIEHENRTYRRINPDYVPHRTHFTPAFPRIHQIAMHEVGPVTVAVDESTNSRPSAHYLRVLVCPWGNEPYAYFRHP